MKTLQQEINKVKSGILLVVKLINKEELNIIIEDAHIIYQRFFSIVDNACKSFKESNMVKTNDLLRIFIILPDDHILAEKLAHNIYNDIQNYIDNEFQIYFRCYIGSIKFKESDNRKVDKILSHLFYGMKNSESHNYYFCYDNNPIDIKKLKQENENLNLLKSSLINKKNKFMYQPIINRETNNVEYYECLLRVLDKNNKYVSVGPMIKDAETKGLINIIDLTVVEMVILELVKDKNISLSINISNIGVVNEKLLKKIEELLVVNDVAKRLIIEITETSLNLNFAATKKFITTLHSYGCSIALDDFGSGFTSFKQIFNLPIDIIKIDGSYIRDILVNDHSKFFVKTLINLANDLGIKTVAEFVENGEIAKFLVTIKVDAMQGNFFLPASDARI
ncbi:MAG: EAL domain-containing protein [Rickettsiales bacterium]|nr:MAG: EAL domain-containing protein [Rickettsiales bacterium]